MTENSEWLTVSEWNERQGRNLASTKKAVREGRIPSKLFREYEVIPGSTKRRLIPMISSETSGPISSDFSKRKNPVYTKKGQERMQATRRRNLRARQKEAAERAQKLYEAHKDLDPLPFLGWILSRPETDLQIAQKAGYADDRAIIRLWQGQADTVRYEYVERVLKAHDRRIEDVYKGISDD